MKKLLFDSLRHKVAEDLHRVLLIQWPDLSLTLSEIYQLLVLPPQKEMGHLAFGTFPLAKALKLGPPSIAQQVAEMIQSQKTKGTLQYSFDRVQGVGPYVNFFFTGEQLFETVLSPILTELIFKQKLFDFPPKTMIEYSQPNTHKELHVGHMRNACLGDSVVRLNRYAGVSVISTTFPGDVGTHVAKCLWYLKYHNQESPPEAGKGEWLGRMYSKGHLYLEDREDTPDEAQDREKLTAILKQIESKSGEFYDLWVETRKWSIDLMNEIYTWCGIKFDHWYWESDVDSDSVKTVKKYFAEGKLVESEGAIGMDLSSENLGFCVLLKSDGNGLYSTKDIELAKRKFGEHSIERSVYVVDMRQALHFKQVFASLKRLGFSQADQCFHLQYNFVELPDGAMSSRKGNIVPLIKLINQMEAHVKENYLNRHSLVWTQEEIDTTARIIAQGAIKYGMLKMDPNKKIVFDRNEWLKIDGDSGPYIQYAYARIQSLLKKFGQAPSSDKAPSSHKRGSNLKQEVELQLIMQLSQFNSIIASSVETYRPNQLCNFLYEIAKSFSQFYHECPIGSAESENLKQDRLALSQATAKVLKEGLSLLGISVSEKM